jgi:hypothetical protein
MYLSCARPMQRVGQCAVGRFSEQCSGSANYPGILPLIELLVEYLCAVLMETMCALDLFRCCRVNTPLYARQPVSHAQKTEPAPQQRRVVTIMTTTAWLVFLSDRPQPLRRAHIHAVGIIEVEHCNFTIGQAQNQRPRAHF